MAINKQECIGIDIGLNISSITHIRYKTGPMPGMRDPNNPPKEKLTKRTGKIAILEKQIFKPDTRWKTQFKRIANRSFEYYDFVRHISQTSYVAIETPITPFGKARGTHQTDLFGLYFLTWSILHHNGYNVIPVHPMMVKKEAGVGKGTKDFPTKAQVVAAFKHRFGQYPGAGAFGKTKLNRETLADSFFIAAVGLKLLVAMKKKTEYWPLSPIYVSEKVDITQPGKVDMSWIKAYDPEKGPS